MKCVRQGVKKAAKIAHHTSSPNWENLASRRKFCLYSLQNGNLNFTYNLAKIILFFPPIKHHSILKYLHGQFGKCE